MIAHIGRMMLFALPVLLGAGVYPSEGRSQGQASALVAELGKGFTSETVAVNGVNLHYVRGGEGPPIILIHGFPQDWFEYHAIMPRLAKRFTVIAIDLRGVGRSTGASGGFDAANMAEDVYQLATKLKLNGVYVVGHDIGGMVTFALLRLHPEVTRGAMILDAPIPGIDGWDDVLRDPHVWHAGFMQVPGLAEKLVAGRQADYFGYFFSGGKFTPAEIAHFVEAYATTAQLHAMFEMYRAFPDNVKFNTAQRDKIDVPVFLAAGEKSPFVGLLPRFAEGFRAHGFSNVETGIIRDAVHYVVADQPEEVADLIEEHASPE